MPGARMTLRGVLALVALTYGITRGGEHGWADALTMGSFVAAVLLLATAGM